jgi:hypothetical protein
LIPYIGDYKAGSTVRYYWATNGSNGASITRATNGNIRVYKNTSTTQRTSSNGITDTEDFDSLTGLHVLAIDLSDNTDASFYAAGNDYFVVLEGAVIDGQTVNCPLFAFSIENRTPRADAVQWLGTALATPDTAGYPKVTIKDGTGAGELQLTGGAVETTSILYGEGGSITYTYTVYDTNGTTPLVGCSVYVSADSAGTQRSQTKVTDDLGQVQFDLNPATVYFWRSHPTRTFSNPDSEVVS